MPNWSKKNTTKAIPSKIGYEGRNYLPRTKKDVELKHNIYDLVGANLLKAFDKGKLTEGQLDDMLEQISFEVKYEGKGYGVGLGYNVTSKDMRDQYRLRLTKDIF